MVVLYSILGQSPGVVTESLKWTLDNYNEKVKAFVIYTKSEDVVNKISLLKELIRKDFGNDIDLRFFKLPIYDIENNKDLHEFLVYTRKIFRKTSNDIDNNEKVILNISGGRKIMSILLSVYHPFIFDKLDEIIQIISYQDRKDLVNAEKVIMEKYFKKRTLDAIDRRYIDAYFYSNGQYRVFRIPILPYPSAYKNMISGLSSSPFIDEIKAAYSIYEKEINYMLENDIISIDSEKRITPSWIIKTLGELIKKQ